MDSQNSDQPPQTSTERDDKAEIIHTEERTQPQPDAKENNHTPEADQDQLADSRQGGKDQGKQNDPANVYQPNEFPEDDSAPDPSGMPQDISKEHHLQEQEQIQEEQDEENNAVAQNYSTDQFQNMEQFAPSYDEQGKFENLQLDPNQIEGQIENEVQCQDIDHLKIQLKNALYKQRIEQEKNQIVASEITNLNNQLVQQQIELEQLRYQLKHHSSHANQSSGEKIAPTKKRDIEIQQYVNQMNLLQFQNQQLRDDLDTLRTRILQEVNAKNQLVNENNGLMSRLESINMEQSARESEYMQKLEEAKQLFLLNENYKQSILGQNKAITDLKSRIENLEIERSQNQEIIGKYVFQQQMAESQKCQLQKDIQLLQNEIAQLKLANQQLSNRLQNLQNVALSNQKSQANYHQFSEAQTKARQVEADTTLSEDPRRDANPGNLAERARPQMPQQSEKAIFDNKGISELPQNHPTAKFAQIEQHPSYARQQQNLNINPEPFFQGEKKPNMMFSFQSPKQTISQLQWDSSTAKNQIKKYYDDDDKKLLNQIQSHNIGSQGNNPSNEISKKKAQLVYKNLESGSDEFQIQKQKQNQLQEFQNYNKFKSLANCKSMDFTQIEKQNFFNDNSRKQKIKAINDNYNQIIELDSQLSVLQQKKKLLEAEQLKWESVKQKSLANLQQRYKIEQELIQAEKDIQKIRQDIKVLQSKQY